jgi:hypothetical protein
MGRFLHRGQLAGGGPTQNPARRASASHRPRPRRLLEEVPRMGYRKDEGNMNKTAWNGG